MEKDQLDSLATVAVGSEKIPPSPHSHYAPSEIYSSSESPPAYSRPPMKSIAVQIVRIIAVTLITISIIIGSFILASAWLQARASCTPESIAAMQAQMGIQQPQQGEFFKRLQPEALIQDSIEARENLQSLSESSLTNTQSSPSDATDKKSQSDDKEKLKGDNENDTDNQNEDDYDDSEFPPVHIKLPLQLDFDDLAGIMKQQTRSLVSCVVERRRSDEFADDGADQADNNNNTDRPRGQRLSGERVAIICQTEDPRRQESGQQEQDILTPIIVPLGSVQMPMQQQEQDYQYKIQEQFPIPAFQQHEMNQIDNRVISDIRSRLPEIVNMLERFGPQMARQQQEVRPVPFELRPVPIEIIRGMTPPMDQEQQPPHVFGQEQPAQTYQHDQTQGMVPPPPPPHQSGMIPEAPQNDMGPIALIKRMIISQNIDQRSAQPQENPDKSPFPLTDIPIAIQSIIQQVPYEIRNIIQHITDEARPIEVPEGARREEVQNFKPFPEHARPVPLTSFLPAEVRNFLKHDNIESRRQNNFDEQSEHMKSFSNGRDQEEKDDNEHKQLPMPSEIGNILHVVQGRAFVAPRFEISTGSVESMDVPVEARARVTVNNPTQVEKEHQQHQQQQQQQQQQPQDERVNVTQEPQPQLLAQPSEDHVMIQQEQQAETNHPHFIYPRSIPDALVHPRGKRTRRCACQCA